MRRTERNHEVRRFKRAVAAALVPLALLSLSTTLRAQSYTPPVQQSVYQETAGEDGPRFALSS